MEILNLTASASATITTSPETTGSVETPPGTPNERSMETDGLYYSDSEYNSGDEELSDNDIKKAYQDMYSKWINLCKLNKKLEDQVANLIEERYIFKRAMINYEFQATEKTKALQETRFQPEETQKTLKMLNLSSAKLDHILSIEKSFCDHHGLGYTGEASSSKTVFIKASSPHLDLDV
uniref:Uncharacterized protein n=1 Tax=Ficus carica TaxID=3494 RepID=A0AA88JDH6_FICCA|nr:hypothetical protein TIFTF001_038173 [Ficus carica]GMN69142.1 hypothetical protein TIFTF001_038189 [Ficus carica]